MTTLRERVLEWRTRHKINKSKMALLMGLSRTSYCTWESGKSEFHEVNRLRIEKLIAADPPKNRNGMFDMTDLTERPREKAAEIPTNLPSMPSSGEIMGLLSAANAQGRADIVQRLAQLSTHIYAMADEITSLRDAYEDIKKDFSRQVDVSDTNNGDRE